MDNNILDFNNVTKKPWYKRAWRKIKKVCSSIWEWIKDNWEDCIGPILLMIWTYTIAFLLGRIFGLNDKENNKAYYDAGQKEGYKNGYIDCTKDIKASGYQMYGGYGDDTDKVIIKKISEEVTEVDIDEQ